MNKKEYMKKYYQEHRQQMIANKKKWDEQHPEYKKEYYLQNKQKFYDQHKVWRDNNSKRFSELCCESRKRRVQKLREQGCINAWNVIIKHADPKFKEVV